MLYFAYGSNMLTERLQRRVPSALPLGTALLGGHQLRWHKRSLDGSGKCSVLETGRDEDRVLGVLFRFDPAEKPRLDAAESLGVGYGEKEVEVLAGADADTGSPARAFTYTALEKMIDDALEPFHWYKHLVLSGARLHGLPEGYVRQIEDQPAYPDPDPERVAVAAAIFDAAGVEWNAPHEARLRASRGSRSPSSSSPRPRSGS